MKLKKILEIGKFWWLLLLVYWALLFLSYFKVIVGYWIDNILGMATVLVFAWAAWVIATGAKKFIRRHWWKKIN